ncbi:MAG TPA: hypothetical protein VEK34_00790 [Methylocella sp.]|nr:hypothetical protein [Methylocella sp.]
MPMNPVRDKPKSSLREDEKYDSGRDRGFAYRESGLKGLSGILHDMRELGGPAAVLGGVTPDKPRAALRN